MPGKCVFNSLWTINDKYKEWLAASTDRHKAKCLVCKKEFDVGRMGESAVKAHMTGQRHLALFKVLLNSTETSIKQYFGTKNKDLPLHAQPTDLTPSSSNSSSAANSHSVSSYALKEESLDAEIKWAMKCVNNNYSANSCEGISDLFADMFPDSEIAKHFSCGATKCSYLVCFGLAPYFKSNVIKCVNEADHYSILFDESLNHATQRKQMDVHIRFWDKKENSVRTRYYTSIFMGHSTAEDILFAIREAICKLNFSKVTNLSMDGPAVNWKVFSLLQDMFLKECNSKLINVGSCTLHTLNNCFKHGCDATSWGIDSLLMSLYWLFKDSPARRQDYLELSTSGKLPCKFCKHRWLENGPAAERALEIFEDIKCYVLSVEKGKCTKPKNKSYSIIAESSKDVLMPVKLNVFLLVVKIIQPFLIHYQTDHPMLPFLAEDLKTLVLKCLNTFSLIKHEVVEKLKSTYKLSVYDFDDKSAYTSISKISTGFVGDKILKNLSSKQKVSERQVQELKHECRSFILTLAKNLMEKSAIKYLIVRSMSCLDPCLMFTESESCHRKMQHILSILSSCNKIKEKDCDMILLEFLEFLNAIPTECPYFAKFNPSETHIDKFLFNQFNNVSKYEKIWEVIKLLLIISHGQATVERGFSVNKHMEVENLHEDSYICKRLVSDEIRCCGGLEKVSITKEMRIGARGARQKYIHYLDEQRAKRVEDVEKKKRNITEELQELKCKKARLQKVVDELVSSADKLSERAERTENIHFLTQSNSFRRTAKEKSAEISTIDTQLNKILAELKQ